MPCKYFQCLYIYKYIRREKIVLFDAREYGCECGKKISIIRSIMSLLGMKNVRPGLAIICPNQPRRGQFGSLDERMNIPHFLDDLFVI